MLDLIKFWSPPTALFFINEIISLVGIAAAFPDIDIALHFLGGCCIAYSLTKTLSLFKPSYTFYDVLQITSGVMVFAVFWEFYEFLLPFLDIGVQNPLDDTLFDLFLGYLGGWVTALIFWKKINV